MWAIKSGYSFRAAAGILPDVIARLEVIGARSAALCDRASTFGFTQWAKQADKAGIKPAFGVELAVSPDPLAKKPQADFWTFIAIDNTRPVNELVALATDQFRYQPLLTYEQANAATGVFKIVGPYSDYDKAENTKFTFVGLSPSLAPGQYRKAVARKLKFAAHCDNRYPSIEDTGLYEIIAGRNADSRV